MRERAEASLSPSPWHAFDNAVYDSDDHLVITSDVDILDDDVPHIASWHPAVALAVADWLEVTAENVARASLYARGIDCEKALTVARAYLGGQA